MVGSQYQAEIPVGLSHYNDDEKGECLANTTFTTDIQAVAYFNVCVLVKVYEEEDKLLWCPDMLSECKVRNYLRDALSQTTDGNTDDCTFQHIRDNEQVFPLTTLSLIHIKICLYESCCHCVL